MAQFLRLPMKHRTRPDDLPGIAGPARVDRRTKNLTKRIWPGDVAIIDHVDLDRVSADALIRRQVAAVVNAAASISGRYPNYGPQLLIDAGIPLVDDAGPELLAKAREGMMVRLNGETLYAGDDVIAKGRLQTAESVAAAMAEAKAGMATQLQAFVANTLEYMTHEGELLIDGIGAPELRTRIENRHVLVVVRGYHHREDLATLRSYIREFKPLMIGVDGGADALIEAGYRPHLIVGDMDSVSDRGLRCGAVLVVHAYPDGRAPGLARVKRLGLSERALPTMQMERTTFADVGKGLEEGSAIVEAFTHTVRKAIALGAEAIIPGQLYLSEAIVRAGVTRIDEVPIVDGLAAVVKMAEVMADFKKLGITVSRRGYTHARPPDDVLEHARKFHKKS